MLLVSVADVKHAPRVPLYPHRIPRKPCKITTSHISAVELRDAPHISARLRIPGNSGAASYRAASGVVGRETQLHVAVIVLQKLLQMPNSGIDVLFRIERV